MEIEIHGSTVSGTVNTPCSKSYAQRAFAAALLAEGESRISNLELCDDTRSALDVISCLGAQVIYTANDEIVIKGGFRPSTDNINIGESGLSTRLFTPISALSDRPITINGRGTMLKRPIGMMIKPLGNLGVEVESNGFLPITVKGPIKGGETEVDGYVSSQFITGLLMALPMAENDTVLHIDKLNSIPYIDMTIATAEHFGVKIDHNNFSEFFIKGNQTYRPADFAIEGDWSSAAFMLVAGAVAGNVKVRNMKSVSRQADVAIVDVLSRVGAEIVTTPSDICVSKRELRAFEYDATHSPDLFPILAVLAANCNGTSTIKGVKRLVYKESNRAEAIVKEFSNIGINVTVRDEDYMDIEGSEIRGGEVFSHNDHRIAMAAAVAGLTSRDGVRITAAEAVAKSYPSFWEDFQSIRED